MRKMDLKLRELFKGPGRVLRQIIAGIFEAVDPLIENLAKTGRTQKQLISICYDAVAVVLSLWVAYSLRFGTPFGDFGTVWHVFLLLPVITVAAAMGLGVYRWVIRASTKRLAVQVVKTGFVSSIALLSLLYLFPVKFEVDLVTPRSIFIIYGLVFIAVTLFARLAWQELVDPGSDRRSKGEPVAVFGAGDAGRQLVSLLKLGWDYNPVLFLDDDKSLIGTTINGLNVFNARNTDIAGLIRQFEIGKIILALPSVKGDEYQQVLSRVDGFGIPVLTMPSIPEMLSGQAAPDQIREVSLDDLLGRREIEPDRYLMKRCVEGKVVLVSGGGGSIGSEICRQIMTLKPTRLIVLEQSEENLYEISEELEEYHHLNGLQSGQGPKDTFIPILGSVTDEWKLESIFSEYAIDTVYHAAAYKHVPIVEHNPEEGVQVNVFGTLRLTNAAIKHNVNTFVLISTDKAVRPTNVMGSTKRVAEMIVQAQAQRAANTAFCAVRFGNVLGSSGSVVPKFKKQILQGGPVTLTHKLITRYFMTIPEAAQLVLQATSLARSGEVFVLDMGEPVKIYDLAEKMIKLMGKTIKDSSSPDGDIEIKIEGLRPGEKLYEELFISDDVKNTQLKMVYVENQDFLAWSKLKPLLDQMTAHLANGDIKNLRNLVMLTADAVVVPTQPPNTVPEAVMMPVSATIAQV